MTSEAVKMDVDKHRQYRQSLGDQVNNIEQEARMLLPGIQALFGFQLMAVFNQGFKANLLPFEQALHLLALLLVSISGILVVAPAAYHRQANHQISKHFVELSSKYLASSMAPLALGTCVDIYLVAKVIVGTNWISLVTASIVFFLYTWIWFVLPRLRAKKIEDMPIHDLAEERKTT